MRKLLESGHAPPGRAATSELVLRVRHDDPDERMPPKGGPLSAEQIAVLARWIDEGLAWEPDFTFKSDDWVAPLKPRRVEVDGPGHPIDLLIAAQAPAALPLVDDAGFLRRAHLDLVGLLPTEDELAAFLADEAPDKRDRAIDALLARDRDYADHWLSFWNDLLRNDYAGTGYIDGGRKQITGWLHRALRDNKPYDQFVRELIDPGPESEGFIRGIKWRGNVNASQVAEVQFAQNVSQVFLGENLKCASCHDSFINDWKLTDAYGMAAIFTDKPLAMYRCDKPTGETMGARFLWPELGDIDPAAPRAAKLARCAELMTSPGNGRLARTLVNRVCQRLMGRGLVEPVDEMGNRPWHPDLLDYLAFQFQDGGYDIRAILGHIARSRAYQARTATTPADPGADYVFAGPLARRLTAEQFIDAVWRLTGTAPGAPHAKIDTAPPAATGATSGQPAGRWFWSDAKAFATEPAGRTIVFRAELPTGADSISVTCDNAYILRLRGKVLARDDNWETVERHPLPAAREPRVLEIEARNAGSGPNPAGLYTAVFAGEKAVDLDWTWRDGEGWKPVAAIPGAIWAPRVNAQIVAAESRAPAPTVAVRAALMKADPLQSSLGRPNRDQVVSTRPAQLTTLQALDLSNGATLTRWLQQGAGRYAALEPAEAIDLVFRRALSRPATEPERRVARGILGQEASQDSMADFLWSVVMLPEFQHIR